jgi:3-oxoacyl-[acyl-carrier protein] reductase
LGRPYIYLHNFLDYIPYRNSLTKKIMLIKSTSNRIIREVYMLLENRTAMITGAARGIGRDIAMTFAGAGADLALCDVNEEALAETKEEIKGKTGRKVIAAGVDVTAPEDVQNFVKKTLDNFNELDILVNNAGITRDNLAMRMSEEEWDMVLDVNLKGAFNCIKAAIRPMMKKKSGRIVNMASIIGLMGNAGQANYAASKGGLIALTKTMAKELGSRNINVNAIAPGFIKTDMTDKLGDEARERLLGLIPMGRMGETADVANAALFLASGYASYITGQVITVDGGMVM